MVTGGDASLSVMIGLVSYREALLMMGRRIKFINHRLGVVAYSDMAVTIAVDN